MADLEPFEKVISVLDSVPGVDWDILDYELPRGKFLWWCEGSHGKVEILSEADALLLTSNELEILSLELTFGSDRV